MLRVWMLAWLLCVPAATAAQSALPSGSIIPVSLDGGINAAKVRAGQEIHATVMQDVPGTTIHRHARVTGHVSRVETSKDGHLRLEISFDAVKSHGQTIPIRTNLRALASFLEVEEAQVPEEMASRGLSPETWDTEQIGGEQVYRGGGPVAVGNQAVGKPTPWGALATPRTQAGLPCRGTVGEASQPQAMWLFSSNACGVYGFANLRIEHAGRTDPKGVILLASSDGKLNLTSGTGLLLRVLGKTQGQ